MLYVFVLQLFKQFLETEKTAIDGYQKYKFFKILKQFYAFLKKWKT